MNRRKKIQRYSRLHISQLIRCNRKQMSTQNMHVINCSRMLIAARKRVDPWRVVVIRGFKENRVTGFEII
jgi:hypothetical protein